MPTRRMAVTNTVNSSVPTQPRGVVRNGVGWGIHVVRWILLCREEGKLALLGADSFASAKMERVCMTRACFHSLPAILTVPSCPLGLSFYATVRTRLGNVSFMVAVFLRGGSSDQRGVLTSALRKIRFEVGPLAFGTVVVASNVLVSTMT